MRTSLQQRQPALDTLNTDMAELRNAVEHSRPGTARHHDVEDLEKKMSGLNSRWSDVKAQVDDRFVQASFTYSIRGIDKSYRFQ